MLDIVKNAKSAITSKDFATMLNSLTLFEKEISAGNTDSELLSTFHLLKVLVDKEKNRREEIQKESELYSTFEDYFKKYEEQRALYSEILDDPRAISYVYSASPSNDFEAMMKDYIDSIRSIFSFAPTPINSLKDVLSQRDLLEKMHDTSAFKINKLNGVYEKTLAEQDIAKAEELTKNMKDFEKAFKDANKKFEQDTQKYKSDVAKRKKDKDDFKKDLHDLGLSDDQIKEFTSQGAKGKIKTKIDELNSKTSRTPDEDKLLALLQKAPVLPRLSHPKAVDVAGLEAKYGIDELKAIFAKYEVKDLDELKAKLDPFIHPVEYNYTDTKANSKEAVLAMRHEQALNAVSMDTVTDQKPIDTLPNEAKESIDSAINFIRSQGYPNVAGKNYLRRYEPVIEGKGKNAKVTEVKVITESMDAIVENPKKAYNQALKDFKKRAKMVDPKGYKEAIKKMKDASKELSKDDKKLDELIKRTVSLKSAISSTDIRTVMLDHANKNTSRYIGDELDYQVPHVDPNAGLRKGIFGIKVQANGYTEEQSTALILKDERRSLISTHAYKPNSKVQVQNNRLAKTKAIKDKENEEIEM